MAKITYTKEEIVLLDLKDYIEKLISIFEKKRDMTDSLYKFEEIKGILKILELISIYIEYLETAYEPEPSYDVIDTELQSVDSDVSDNFFSEREDLNI